MTAQDPRSRGAHETHDRLLVARFSLGDELAPDETATLDALLAGCTDCATLVEELRVVQHATAASLAPARTREFFLTPEQAEWLRPNPWQRMLSRFSAPRAATLRPLAGATLAIGILLVGASAVLPRPSNAPASDVVQVVATPDATAALEAMPVRGGASPGVNLFDTQPVAAPSDGPDGGSQARMVAPGSPDGAGAVGAQPKATADNAADSAAGHAPEATAAPQMLSTTSSMEESPPPAARSGEAATPAPSSVAMIAAPVETPAPQQDGAAEAAVAPADDTVTRALMVAGVLLALVSVAVLALIWAARRSTDPLLR